VARAAAADLTRVHRELGGKRHGTTGYFSEATILSGLERSGFGKDLSSYGFEDYTRVKHVMSFLG